MGWTVKVVSAIQIRIRFEGPASRWEATSGPLSPSCEIGKDGGRGSSGQNSQLKKAMGK